MFFYFNYHMFMFFCEEVGGPNKDLWVALKRAVEVGHNDYCPDILGNWNWQSDRC